MVYSLSQSEENGKANEHRRRGHGNATTEPHTTGTVGNTSRRLQVDAEGS